MIYYVLLTHGKRPDRSTFSQHPAARQQLANLKLFGDLRKNADYQVFSDYCRKVLGLRSLPTLATILEAAREQNVTVVLDDIGRLFRATPPDRRWVLAEEIEPYAEHLFGMRQKETFAQLSHVHKAAVVYGLQSGAYKAGKPPAKPRAPKARKDQTEEATRSSISARRRAADKMAERLDQIRTDLKRDDLDPTYKQIAEEANLRGLHTSRGGTWTSSTVGRILKRLERPALAERARKLREAKKVTPGTPEAR